ncbi:MAG: lysophospholipid acyltransferase family protein [Chloroflexota bacterium]
MNATEYRASEQTLVEINIEDMLISFGLEKWKAARPLAQIIFEHPARKFARHVLDFDRGVAAGGLASGSQRMLHQYIRSLTIVGQEHLPQSGPVLILSNHPGMADTLALFSALPRPDLRVLAAERPFLRALPATARYLFFVPESENQRGEVIRQTAAHLRAGGAVLTFPRGKIEPDPSVLPGALQSLEEWSISTGLFVRLIPALPILPVLVSGVIAAPSLHHPLTLLRRRTEDKRRLAATLQILMRELFPKMWPVDVRVDLFPPIDTRPLSGYRRPEEITRALIDQIRPLYERTIREITHPRYQPPLTHAAASKASYR